MASRSCGNVPVTGPQARESALYRDLVGHGNAGAVPVA
jgi:hypothetical protein